MTETKSETVTTRKRAGVALHDVYRNGVQVGTIEKSASRHYGPWIAVRSGRRTERISARTRAEAIETLTRVG